MALSGLFCADVSFVLVKQLLTHSLWLFVLTRQVLLL